MGKDKEEKKNPVIVVKKRRSFSPPSLAEKKDVIAAALTEQATESVSSGISLLRNQFTCRRNSYSRSASQEEEEKTTLSKTIPLDQ